MKLYVYRVWADLPDGRIATNRTTTSEAGYETEHVRAHLEERARDHVMREHPGAVIQIAEWVEEEIPEGGE